MGHCSVVTAIVIVCAILSDSPVDDMANSNHTRILREIAQAQKNTDLSIAVAYQDRNVRNVRALIIGPPDTPYQYGFFEFNLKVSYSQLGPAPCAMHYVSFLSSPGWSKLIIVCTNFIVSERLPDQGTQC